MEALWTQTLTWLQSQLLNTNTAVQALWIVTALAIGFVGAIRPRNRLIRWRDGLPARAWVRPPVSALCDAMSPALALVVLWLYPFFGDYFGYGQRLVQAAVSLAIAWIAIRAGAALIRDRNLARAVAIIAWTLAALHITGLTTPLIGGLDALAINVGESRISVWTALTTTLALVVFLWLAVALAGLAERQLQHVSMLPSSLRVLLGKLVRIVLLSLAFLMGLNTVGVDLSALAVFGGAVGVGIGFGLQKVIGNFISGIILLADRSIKPGDVIAVGDSYGWVKHLNTRHVSVVTRDGKEHLIPNELLITETVENWSYSDNNIRLRLPVGISYNADPREAIGLMNEAAGECQRVLENPAPVTLLTGFGDNSVDLELRFWISDPAAGVSNVKSQVLLGIWDKLKQADIEIPFPQRDVHVRSMPEPAPPEATAESS